MSLTEGIDRFILMGDRVPAPDAMEHVPVVTNQDMVSNFFMYCLYYL